MKAILIKDFLYLRRQSRVLQAALVVFIVLMLLQIDSPQKLIAVISALCAMLAVTLTMNIAAMDEQAKWDTFVRGLPVRIPTIVGAQYVLTVLFSLVGIVAELILVFFVGVFNPEEFAVVSAAVVGVPLLFCSFLLPVYYKFGYQKAIIVMILAVFLVIGMVSFLKKMGFMLISPASISFCIKFSPLIISVIMLLSFFSSCHIYSKKEV